MTQLHPQQLAELATQCRWHHCISLGQGYFTPGSQNLAEQLDLWQFPTDLSGKTVLDIGCSDGGFSLAALERGASRVLAIDVFTSPGFKFVKKYLPLAKRLDYANIDLLSETFLELPLFDITLFTGVLYHLKNPLVGLVRVRRVTRQVALIETLIDDRVKDVPAMVFYEYNEVDNNPTNWWGPNLACFQAMIRVAGFTKQELTYYAVDPQTQLGRAAVLAYVSQDSLAPLNPDNLWTINPKNYREEG